MAFLVTGLLRILRALDLGGFKLESGVRGVSEGLNFVRSFANLGPETPLDSRDSSHSAGRT